MEILVKNVDGIKLFLAIFERTYYGLYMCHFLWQFCNPFLKKTQPKMSYVLYEATFQAGSFAGIHVDSTV